MDNSGFYHLTEEEATEWARERRRRESIDVDFTVATDDWRDEPQWQVWKLLGPDKTTDAWTYLDYEGEWNGLYHYRDHRNGERYELPEYRTAKAWQLQYQIDKLKGARLRKRLGPWIALSGMLSLPFVGLILPVVLTASRSAIPSVPAGVWIFSAIPFIALLTLIARFRGPQRPSLPPFRLFLSDAEIEDRIRTLRNRRTFYNFVSLAIVAHGVYRHERKVWAREFADALGDRLEKKHW